MNAGVTQSDRVRGCYPLSRRFESGPRHHREEEWLPSAGNTEQPQPGRSREGRTGLHPLG